MRIALITRPQWESKASGPTGSSRLIDAPLQELQLCAPDPQTLKALLDASHPWVVFTSPASVQAMDRWVRATGIHPMQCKGLRVAAVGSGTRYAAMQVAAHHADDPSMRWAVNLDDAVVSLSDERADAHTLLAALDAFVDQHALKWNEQTLLVAQGEGNRPTLAEGLAQRHARVIATALYRRTDVPWSESVWSAIKSHPAGECGVVVTTSGVIDRLVSDCASHAVKPQHLVWCTQHAAIADRLHARGITHVRRVSLDAAHLEHDLFEGGSTW